MKCEIIGRVLFLSLGSNRGDRHANIRRAVALIAQALPGCAVCVSEPFESEPWGFESPNGFVNVCVAVSGYAGSPHALLRRMQSVERSISAASHRNADGSYADRDIDIDIIDIEGVRLATPSLTLPHPRAHLREFVQVPLAWLKNQTAQR